MQATKYSADLQNKGFVELRFEKQQLLISTKVYHYNTISFEYNQKTNQYKLYLYDGEYIECDNTQELQEFIEFNKNKKRFDPLRVFGIKVGFILPFIALIIALIYGSYTIFLPSISQNIAMNISKETAYKLGEDTLEALDEEYFEASALPVERQNFLRKFFLTKIEGLTELPPINIEFRSSKKMGANAFALPNGTIVLLDKLTELAEDEEELFSVVAHELGHVYHRHALRQLIQDSVLYLGLVFITGDITSVATLAGLVPVVLLQQHYSREFELEADTYGYKLLKERNIEAKKFINLLQKIIEKEKDLHTQEYLYLSSHPSLEERKKIFLDQ